MSEKMLMDIEDLSKLDLLILLSKSSAGDELAKSILKSWMNSLDFEDAALGGVEGWQLVHTESSSRLAEWVEGKFLGEGGEEVLGVTHFSQLPAEFWSCETHYSMESFSKVEVNLFKKGFTKIWFKFKDWIYEKRTGDFITEI